MYRKSLQTFWNFFTMRRHWLFFTIKEMEEEKKNRSDVVVFFFFFVSRIDPSLTTTKRWRRNGLFPSSLHISVCLIIIETVDFIQKRGIVYTLYRRPDEFEIIQHQKRNAELPKELSFPELWNNIFINIVSFCFHFIFFFKWNKKKNNSFWIAIAQVEIHFLSSSVARKGIFFFWFHTKWRGDQSGWTNNKSHLFFLLDLISLYK